MSIKNAKTKNKKIKILFTCLAVAIVVLNTSIVASANNPTLTYVGNYYMNDVPGTNSRIVVTNDNVTLVAFFHVYSLGGLSRLIRATEPDENKEFKLGLGNRGFVANYNSHFHVNSNNIDDGVDRGHVLIESSIVSVSGSRITITFPFHTNTYVKR
ncbi:MAG: hypothetical protein LBC82_03115 [Oscillospiraceae bacterium]|jgi:hypothetical protein|nr:hypothetical protein [Oscillospiraceae bacterium]